MFRRMIIATLALAALGAMSVGHADPITGTIAVGNPAQTAGEGGITENLAPCDLASEYNGLDGVWLDISEAGATHAVLALTGDNGAVSDVDGYFYDAECQKIDDSALAQNFIALGRGPFVTNVEEGDVPEGAHYLIVNGFFGADIHFELTLS